MPELPEVETVRRGLAPVMEGVRLTRVEQRREDLRFPFPKRFVERLEGRRIDRLDRRAKYLVGHLDSGEVLVMHLGMTGRFTIAVPGGANGRQLGEFTQDAGGDDKHDHVVFHMTGGASITYNDARRFGYMDLVAASDIATHPHFRDVGIEPLGPELSGAFIAAAAKGKKTSTKAFLMDQRIIAGLGNIYVCEALWRARLSPERPVGRLARGRGVAGAERLAPIIRSVLDEAITAGGSTLRDYQKTDGTLGYFQHRFAVYGREGEACPASGCGQPIARVVQSNRSTFFCPACQKD